MTSRVAPWLDGLTEPWEVPAKPNAVNNAQSASGMNGSLRDSCSRIPRPSLSSHSSLALHESSNLRNSIQRTRNPLAILSKNDSNTLRRPKQATTKSAASRSVSYASSESAPAVGTVQQRSKSTSPEKRHETLEWKRRLVQGEVEYGDQTDLFGPSGLENIFAPSNSPRNSEPKPKNRMKWLPPSDASVMPSSPPLRQPSTHRVQSTIEKALHSPDTEQAGGSVYGAMDGNESFRSNPFDLESFNGDYALQNSASNATSLGHSVSDNAHLAHTEDEAVQNRTVSGQTELEQEDFSPVYVSKRTTVSGQVDYAALDSHLVKQFQNNRRDISVANSMQPSQKLNHEHGSDENQALSTDGAEASVAADPSFSFSEDLPTGSPFPNLGHNVQFKRGGYSQQGSFKQRPLSPSPSRGVDSFGFDPSSTISRLPPPGQLPTAPTPPPLATPAHVDEPKSRSSGSPLKLFGPHDTFTTDRLMRRMSQLNPDGTLKLPAVTSVDQEPVVQARTVSNDSSFGNGDLDQHVFDAEITITSASDDEKDNSNTGSPGSEIIAPGSKMPLGFRFEVSPPAQDTFQAKRKLSKHSAAASHESTRQRRPNHLLEQAEDTENESWSRLPAQTSGEVDARIYAEGKRPPTSPFKNPTPKRRRTLHASELENGLQSLSDSCHSQLLEAIGSRKRKDARRGEEQNTADPEVLAQRKILRPRNPTPGQQQNRRQQIHAALREAAEDFVEQQPETVEQVLEQIESSMASEGVPTLEQQAQSLASEVAAFTLKVRKASVDVGERKRSVTTQDFLNEAMTVMNLIRAKARPQSNLGSVEEMEAESFRQSLSADDRQDDESRLRVSRPPSREGSGWRERAPVPTNARVVSHLRKFQEQEEVDDTNFIANSIASLQVDDDERVNDQVVVVDEDANVRITGPPPPRQKGNGEHESQPTSNRSQGSTLNTQGSGGTSTGHTLDTASTRKSDNVGTLAPDAVAHLIGNQVGGMTFDKDRQRWVRFSKRPEKGYGSFLELPSNVTSDDDPFREISDLPVDEQKELRRLSSSGRNAKMNGASMPGDVEGEGQGAKAPAQPEIPMEENATSRPVTRDSSHLQPNHSSSVPSKYTALASSQQEAKIETRATSWSDEEMAKISSSDRTRRQHLAPCESLRQTVGTQLAFEEEVANDNVSRERDAVPIDLETSKVRHGKSSKGRQMPPLPRLSAQMGAGRHMSLRKQTLTSRFNAEAHEQSELSILAPLPGDRMISLSLSVSRPATTWREPGQVTEIHSSPSKGHSSFILSDLPDFTVHEQDEERPSERALASRLAQHAAVEVNDRYALAVKELVKILTDVQEDEPYWEDLRRLDLHGRSLSSLYGLSDFCNEIRDVVVSNNSLQQLQGLPPTVRRLDAGCNMLNSLTSWNHLANLQYLDISNNHLDNLDGLSGLFHLRELRADDNKITRVDGVIELDGLLKLRLRRNKLQTLALDRSQLVRLEYLDVSDNQITSIEYLEKLHTLVDLKLDRNPFTHGIGALDALPALKSLSARNCNLSRLDVWWCSNLTHLSVDDNSLSTIQGIDKLQQLDTLSMRRQTLPNHLSVTILEARLEAREIHLSGNKLSSVHLPHSLLNLRHLELASVGLQELPADFGLRVPNLRTLNLNFNSIKDLRPLLNIQRLAQLTACGNRVQRLRKSIATLERLASLQSLDLRDNPLTQGFYPRPSATTSEHKSLMRRDKDPATEDEDTRAATAEQARYQAAPGDEEEDERHRVRLDEEVALRRRVYDLLLANGCRELVEVDGLGFDRTGAVQKDFVWERLLELGILRLSREKAAGLVE